VEGLSGGLNRGRNISEMKAGVNPAVHRLSGQVAIVTGGTVGIGRATCIALAKQGAQVVIVGRSQERLEQTLAEMARLKIGGEPWGLALDVRREGDMDEMASHTVERFGRIDILVTAAGVLRGGAGHLRTLQHMSIPEWDEVLDTNLKGVFLANRAVLPTMISRRGGNIINISSTSGRQGLAFDSAYCASKFGVIGLSEALAEEMRHYGIRVQVLLPGAIETDMWEQNPLPRPKNILPVERVADFICYLVTLPVDVILPDPIIEPLKVREQPAWAGKSLETGRTSETKPAVKVAGSAEFLDQQGRRSVSHG
jgi:NAD(P)-dependent dehydrogenase (short-subunit alcohol dehydrogenase family)